MWKRFGAGNSSKRECDGVEIAQRSFRRIESVPISPIGRVTHRDPRIDSSTCVDGMISLNIERISLHVERSGGPAQNVIRVAEIVPLRVFRWL